MAKNNNDEFKRNFNNRNIKRTSGKNTYDMFDIAKMRSANAQIKEFLDRQERMIKNNQKLDETNAKIYATQKKQYEQNEKIMKNWNRYINSTLANRSDKGAFFDYVVATQQAQSRPAINFNQGGLRQIPNNVQKLFQTRISNNQNKALDDIYKSVTKSVTDSYKRKNADFSDPKVLEQVNKKIQERVIKQSEGVVKKYGRHTEVLNVATQIFSKAVDKWYSIAKEGLKNQSNAYENTFTNISVRNGITRGQYYGAQWKLNNVLDDMNLRNNIASSDVQQMWNTMANSGLKIDMSSEQARADITAKAIDTVLTGKIVPYLDMSSSAAQQIADTNPNFLKQVRGIGVATTEIQGSSTFITKHLQELVNDIAPMATLAESELGLQFAQLSGSYEYLRNTYNLNDAQIGALYKNTATIYNNPYAALTNGSTDQRLAVAMGLSNNIDFRDISQVDKYARYSTNFFANMVPEGNVSPFFGGMLTSLGITGTDALTNAILNERNIDMDEVTRAGLEVATNTNSAAERASQDYANDKNQTNKKLQDVTMENLMNELAVANEWMGNWAEVIVTAIDAIGTLILTKIVGGTIGKSLGLLGGSAAGGTGTGLLATGGSGIALGTIGGIAAGTALVTAIGAGIYTANNKNKEYTSDKDLDEFKNSGSSFSQNSTAQKFVSGAGANLSTSGLDWWGKTMKSAGSAMDTWGLGIRKGWTGIVNAFDGKEGWTNDDYIGQNAQYFNSIIAGDLRDINDANDRAGYYAAYALLLDQVGSLESTKKMGKEISKKDLESLFTSVDENGVSLYKSYGIDNKISYFINNDRVPSARDGVKAWGKIDYKSVYGAPDGSYRYGLDEVPYDGYKAVLHEGEAVLTASTANTLRNLLDEYKQTSTQSVNFEAIIQTQTAELVNKMSEIINVIQGGSSVQQLDNLDKMKTDSILTNSFMHMKSTKSF